MRVSFEQVFNLLIKKGIAEGIVSSRGTYYTVKAKIYEKGDKQGTPVIITHPINCVKGGNIYITKEYWGLSLNEAGTRAGGIYNGDYSIEDWYDDNK